MGSEHKAAVPLEKVSFFHTSVSAVNCQVVEILPTSPEGANSADVTPEEVEYVIGVPVFTSDSCPAGFTLNSGEWVQLLVP